MLIIFLMLQAISAYSMDYRISDPFLNDNIIAIQLLHDQSAAGDKDKTDQLIRELQALIQLEPENQLYRVYLGSAYTLKSRDVFPGPSKLRFLKDGLKSMDSAVKKDPQNCSVRFIRAVNNYHLPAFINRRDNARKDFEILLKQINADPGKLDQRTIQAIHYFAGLAFKQTDRESEARMTWMAGLALKADARLNLKISQELANL
ncbi:MAG: hypothetical protein AAGH72_05635 [Verrucomicrobiota bacterium]